jgi:hypothetical protein
MAYCDDCGLSSCYERGGYCELGYKRARAKADALKPNVERFTRVLTGGKYAYSSGTSCPPYDSDEWIEYIPLAAVVEQIIKDVCSVCGGTDENGASCWVCR